MEDLGIIYFLQPSELVGVKSADGLGRYKVGCSQDQSLNRCQKGYKVGTEYIIVMGCRHPYRVEAKIKAEFTKKFNLIAGKEYFEGDKIAMMLEFQNIVNSFVLPTPLKNTLKNTPEETPEEMPEDTPEDTLENIKKDIFACEEENADAKMSFLFKKIESFSFKPTSTPTRQNNLT
jgi:hypothetical protein